MTKRKKKEKKKKDYDKKMFLLSLYLLDTVNTSKTSHASKFVDIVGRIYVINFNETLVKTHFFKKTLQ